ncbi:Nicotianamine aminotransferase [Musa troglodytarum]|uniref:Nicotianamine aminotransferase n=1 Tax=Musa troglodytarum TaxID=320322 RepID=A0A9E7HRP5_9LILI|nr:Nicotianamine aminotransferase [Musa troglodytarum]
MYKLKGIHINWSSGICLRLQFPKMVANAAKRLGIMVIADEVYDHLVFGSNPFVPMGVFGNTVPVLTLGSISKRWVVPGWRLGWIVTSDPNGVFKETKIVDNITTMLNITTDPATFIRGNSGDEKLAPRNICDGPFFSQRRRRNTESQMNKEGVGIMLQDDQPNRAVLSQVLHLEIRAPLPEGEVSEIPKMAVSRTAEEARRTMDLADPDRPRPRHLPFRRRRRREPRERSRRGSRRATRERRALSKVREAIDVYGLFVAGYNRFRQDQDVNRVRVSIRSDRVTLKTVEG